MSKREPMVTVLLPVYNGMPYIQEAVKSILEQTYQDLHLLVVDDGSTDETGKYIGSITDDRVIYRRLDHRGPGAACNIGLHMIKTRYTARMDADDIALPRRIEIQMSFLESHPEIHMIGSQFKYFTSSRKKAGFQSHLPLKHPAIRKNLLSMRHAFCNPTIFFRTGSAKAIGGFNTDSPCDDLLFMMRMAEEYRTANLDETLLYYRVHHNSGNAANMKTLRMYNRHAVYCNKCGTRNETPLSTEEYIQSHPLTLTEELTDTLDAMAYSNYRRGLAYYLDDYVLQGLGYLGLSCLLSPSRFYHYLEKKLIHHGRRNRP